MAQVPLMARPRPASKTYHASGSAPRPPHTRRSGSQDLVAAEAPPPLVGKCFSGTPGEVIDQATRWRDYGARYIGVADASALQRSLRNGLSAAMAFGNILRGIKKL